MEQELIKDLNKQIIVQFVNERDALNTKIASLEKTYKSGNLDEETLTNLKEIIEKMKDVRNKLTGQIERMHEKDNKGISLFQMKSKRYSTVLKGTKFEGKFANVSDKSEIISKNISNLNETIDNLKGDSRVVSSIKKSLEKRIEALKKKQGKIQNRQRKIVDKATKDKLSKYLKEVKKGNNMAKVVVKNNARLNKQEKRINQLLAKKNELTEVKEQLLSNKNLLVKGLGLKAMFTEKFTASRIKGLQAKNGVVNFANKQVVKRGVNPSIIQRMKEKAMTFSKAIGDSFKKGVDTFKSYYPESTRVR